MKKNINIRNIIIVMLCITIIFMGIGFSFLASKLDKSSKETDTFDVTITKVEAQTSVKGGNIDPSATKELIDDGKTVNFNFTLNVPNDELAYEITIKNTGDVPAKIIRLISSPDYITDPKTKLSIEPITITQTPIENQTLAPEEATTVKLLVKYNMSNTIKQMTVPYKLTVLAASEK